MNKKLKNMSDKKFRRIVGVKKETFGHMRRLVNSKLPKIKRAGPKDKLSNMKKLLLTLEYWTNYNSLLEVGEMFEISETTASRIVIKIENILANAGLCKLPGKKSLLTSATDAVLIDATECAIERPKRNKFGRRRNRQKHYYSGKKKRHTIKAQIVIINKKIHATSFSNGRKHDYRLLKESKVRLHKNKSAKVDSGYQGLQKQHSDTELPKKNTKKNPLNKEDKAKNKNQARCRVPVEHVIGWIKKFKIISTRYRNRRKRFGLRFNLICGLFNYEKQGEL
jgi:hypothetical protein